MVGSPVAWRRLSARRAAVLAATPVAAVCGGRGCVASIRSSTLRPLLLLILLFLLSLLLLLIVVLILSSPTSSLRAESAFIFPELLQESGVRIHARSRFSHD